MAFELHATHMTPGIGVPQLAESCARKLRECIDPVVVEFSGGRSSGLMLLMLLEADVFRPVRGDVVIFNNTAAEHPATYDFVRKMKRITEACNVPFFLTEQRLYQLRTKSGDYRWRASYQLVNSDPLADHNPDGYSWHGEIYLDTILHTRQLPTIRRRTCTINTKIYITHRFLRDWTSGASILQELGHRGKSKLTFTDRLAQIKKSRIAKGCSTDLKIMPVEYEKLVWSKLDDRPCFRPRQIVQGFTTADLTQRLDGSGGGDYTALLGYRHDEPRRTAKMRGHNDQPGIETQCAPLAESGIDQPDVFKFWAQQPDSIKPFLPVEFNLSNCVFCFLRGTGGLIRTRKMKDEWEATLPADLQAQCREPGPNHYQWWIDTEEMYRRPGKSGQHFGFFNITEGRTYRNIIELQKSEIPLFVEDGQMCGCTD